MPNGASSTLCEFERTERRVFGGRRPSCNGWRFRCVEVGDPLPYCFHPAGWKRNRNAPVLHEPEKRFVDFQRLAQIRFMVPMRPRKRMGASHEPKCSAGFPTCGFWRLSSRPMEWRAGKPAEPAVWKDRATMPAPVHLADAPPVLEVELPTIGIGISPIASFWPFTSAARAPARHHCPIL